LHAWNESKPTVVGDRHVANVVNEHLVKTHRTEGRLDNVGNGRGGHHCFGLGGETGKGKGKDGMRRPHVRERAQYHFAGGPCRR